MLRYIIIHLLDIVLRNFIYSQDFFIRLSKTSNNIIRQEDLNE